MKAVAVIVSAGKGHRFTKGKSIRPDHGKKQFHLLAGKPILAHTLDQFEACPLIHSVFLVVGQEDMDHCLEEIVEKYRYQKVSQIVPGGKRRQDSVRNGIEALSRDVDVVVIHDGVRPFVTREMIEESIHTAFKFEAALVAMPVKDTIKMVHADGTVFKTLDRETLWQIQTPQTFRVNLIKEAYRRAAEEGFVGTDDASLVERLGVKVLVVPGSYSNLKITTPEDLILAELFLQTKNGENR
jgi:2-C-methyl-D-erythritol 4-phosphate cytidylyltransferase